MQKQNLLTDFFRRASFSGTEKACEPSENGESNQSYTYLFADSVSTADGQDEFTNSSRDISEDRDGVPAQPKLKSYPKKVCNSSVRRFNASWFTQFPYMEYSEKRDLVFCFVCRHFSKKATTLVDGYGDWKNALRDFKFHWESSDHEFSVEKYLSYKASKDSGAVSAQLSSQRRENILRNRRVLASHIKILLLCAKQEIALRGHEEGPESRNRGNFLEISDFLKGKCPELAADAARMPKKAMYTHHSIQNELLEVCESLALRKIREEVQKSPSFAIMADESRDSGGWEQLSVCLRYVRGADVVERFIGFFKLEEEGYCTSGAGSKRS